MRIKKILSLAVVLAMVMAVVPMFGLTASAAEAPSGKWLAYKDAYFNSGDEGKGDGTNEGGLNGGVYAAASDDTAWQGGTGELDTCNFGSARHAVFGYQIPENVTKEVLDSINKATVFFHISGVKQVKANATLGVYKEENTAWTESNCKKEVFGATKNDPNLGELLGTTQAITKGANTAAATHDQWVSVDITDYVKSLITDGKTEFSIRVAAPAGGFGISSRENGDNLTSYIDVEYNAEVTVNYVNESKENIGTKVVQGLVGKDLEITNDVAPVILDNNGKVYARDIGQIITLTNEFEQTVEVTYTEADTSTNYEDTRDAKWFAMEYTQAEGKLYKDVGITDANGNTIAGFTIDNAKLWIADGERTLSLKNGSNRRITNGTGGRNNSEGIANHEYHAGETIRIVVENYLNGYSVTYFAGSTALANVKYSGTAYGISSPDKWDYTGGGDSVNAENATSVFTNAKYYIIKPSEIDDYVKNAMFDAVGNSIPDYVTSGENIELKDSVQSSFEALDVTYTGELCDESGSVCDTDIVEKRDINYYVDFNGNKEKRTKTVEIFPVSRIGKTYATGDAMYKIGEENLISKSGTAASFEDEDGNFSLKGWKNVKDEDLTPPPANNWYAVGTRKAISDDAGTIYDSRYSIPDGNYALGSRWHDGNESGEGKNSTCTIHTTWNVEGGKQYYFSFYAKTLIAPTGAKGIYAYYSNAKSGGLDQIPTGEQVNQVSTTNEWQKYEYIFDAQEDGVIGFYAYNLGASNDWNSTIKNYFDNFELYEATKQTETLTKIDDIPVITGTTKDQLPTKVIGVYTSDAGERRAEVDIAWDEEQTETTYTCSDGTQTYQVKGTVNEQQYTVNVIAYHDFTVDFKSSDKDQNSARKYAIKLPVKATKTVTAEFKATFVEPENNWIIFASDDFTGYFGGEQVAISFNNLSSLRPVNGDGNGNRASGYDPDKDQATLELNKEYSFVVTIDVENSNYDLWAFDQKGEQIAKVDDFGFRKKADNIDSISIFTNGGNNPKSERFSVSDVKVTYDIVEPTTYKVTAKYYATDDHQGEPDYTVEKYAKANGSVTFDAFKDMLIGDGFYSAEAASVSDVNAEKSVDVQLTKNENMPVVSDMFSYGVHTEGKTSSDNGTSTYKTEIKEGEKGYRVANLDWNNVGVVVMAFDLPASEQKLEKANLNMYITAHGNNDHRTNIVYAIDSDKVDLGQKALTNDVDGVDYNKDNWKSLTNAVEVCKQIIPANDGAVKYELNLSKVNVTGDKLILAFTNPTGHEISVAGKAYNEGKNAPYLSDITTADAPVGTVDAPTLGWDGKGFTINYSGTSGQTLLIYHENPVTGALMPADTKAIGEENTGVAVSTPNTNRIYAAAVYDKVAGEMSAKASIYSLVVDEVLNGYTAIDPDKLAKVNEVIANGGVYYSDELATDNLTDETKKIMSVTAENEVTINSELVKLNIGFTYNGGKLFVGTGDMTADEAEGTFSTLKIEDGAVTLSGKIENGEVTGQEAVTLSLDAVNIEFIETLIEEAQADGVDADVVLTPEI